MNELIANLTYGASAVLIWAGAIHQIYYVFRHKSARDITLFWLVTLTAALALTLFRVFTSPYIVWKVAQAGSLALTLTLLGGVWKYGRRK